MIYSKADAAALVLEPVEKGYFSGNNPAGRLPIKMIFIEGSLIEINKFYKVKRGTLLSGSGTIVLSINIGLGGGKSEQILWLRSAQRRSCGNRGANFLLMME